MNEQEIAEKALDWWDSLDETTRHSKILGCWLESGFGG